MDGSLGAIRFLASSENRVAVLTALADGAATRRDLQGEVDASRSTVARIVDEAGRRDWVASEGTRYWLTPLGESMVASFCDYLETVEGLDHLGAMVNEFPPPLTAVDPCHLQDATVVEPSVEDPAAPYTRAYDVFRGASSYRGLNHTSFPHFVRAIRDGVEAGRLDFAQVLEGAFVETIRAEPERAAVWRSLTDHVWRYPGTVPINLHVIDGQVLVWLGRERGDPAGLLLSENEAVVEWAVSLYERYRAEAEPVAEL